MTQPKLSDFPFPLVLWFNCSDTTKFQDARDLLVESGLISKPYIGLARPLEERTTNPRSWQEEGCCVMPMPDKSHLAETELYGWGIYRVCFQDKVEPIPPILPVGKEAAIEFKYCVSYIPEGEMLERIIKTNPMQKLAEDVYHLVKPHEVVGVEGNPLVFP